MEDSVTGSLRFEGGTVLTPHEIVRDARLLISGERITALSGRGAPGQRAGGGAEGPPEAGPATTIDTRGMTLLPGLINIHDHLLGTWHSKIGGRRYGNVYQWLEEVHRHPLRSERMRSREEDIYLLGAYKNLFSGVTTVLDHYIRHETDFYASLPIRVVHEFGRTWTLRDETEWGGTIEEELEGTGGRQPYVIHIAEGVDEDVRAELTTLARRGAVAPNTLLVHAIALSDEEIDLVADRGASVAWCPASNIFLYGATANLPRLLSAGITIAIGTDSSWSGSANLLDEMRYARRCAKEVYGLELEPSTLLSMVTTNPARALLRDSEMGALAPGYLADLLILEGESPDPYERALAARPDDIDLLLVGGRPVYGALRHRDLAAARPDEFSRVRVGGREKFVTGDPAGLRSRLWDVIGEKKDFPSLPIA